MNKVYNIDCIEYMKTMKDNSVDLVVTDPPYLMNYKSNRRVVMDKFDYIKNDKGDFGLIKQYIDECYRIMKDNTAIYMFCSWHHVDLFKQAIESKFKLKNIIVWNKNNHGSGDLRQDTLLSMNLFYMHIKAGLYLEINVLLMLLIVPRYRVRT